MRIDFQEAFILHSRPYRDTSMLLDLFTREYGVLRAIARGVRKAKSKLSGMLLPFIYLAVSLSGKHELVNLSKAEPRGLTKPLVGRAMVCGLYLNELLIKLLHVHDPHPVLFDSYAATLGKLQSNDNFAQQLALRLFEKTLLREIGYALQLDKDANGDEIEQQRYYSYKFGAGLFAVDTDSSVTSNYSAKNLCVSGQSILALHAETLTTPAEYNEVKLLLRRVIDSLLPTSLKTRELLL